MKVIVAKDYEELSWLAAQQVAELMLEKPKCVLGLATGSSPEGMYKNLIALNQRGILDFSKVVTFNLDEYKSLTANHPQSYRYFMDVKLFNHINIDKRNTLVPNGIAEDIETECEEYDRKIQAAGGIDLQILGVGTNGHIGFNEPSDFLHLHTHLTDLKKETIEANARFFSSIEEVPRQAITMGLGEIMKAKKIMLLANGEKKAEIISRIVDERISTRIPASILQIHNDVTIIVDKAAGALLKNSYKDVVAEIQFNH